MAEPATLVAMLTRAARFPEAGLRFLDRNEKPTWCSWPWIHGRAAEVAARLAALGIRRGDRVALVYPTSPELIEAFFGILTAGAVPVPLYPPVRLGRLEEYHRRTARMVELSGARLVLADRRVRRLLGEATARARPAFGCKTLDALPEPAEVPLPPVDSEDLALVQFSSGTTADPKPVALSHRALVAHTRLLNSFWPDEEPAPGEEPHGGISWLPLYHDMGLIGCVFPALERPAVLTLIGPEVFVTRPAVWLRAISRYRATLSPAPNFAYGLCVAKVRDEELQGVDLSSWQVALNGAEPVAPSVLRAFQERFAPYGLRPEALTPVYGLSEAALAVTFSDLGKPFTARRFDRDALSRQGEAREAEDGLEIVSVGRPLPAVRLEVRDGRGRALPEGRIGRLWVESPALMRGYLDQPRATAEVLQGGFLDTGDLGFLHRGELYLTGRAKDMLLLRGKNFAPQLVEQAVDPVAGTRTGCAVAVSHLAEGGEGEELLLFVELANDAERGEAEALPEACRKAVLASTGARVDEVLLLEAGTLPRTSSGKLRRSETLERYLGGALTPPKRVTAWGLATALGRSALAHARVGRGAVGG